MLKDFLLTNPVAKKTWDDKYRGDFTQVLETMMSEISQVWTKDVFEELDASFGFPILSRIKDIFKKGRGLPAGRILFYFCCLSLGEERKLTPMNCFVIPIEDDSMEAILDFNKNMGLTFKAGGGVGSNISGLRPRHAPVNNSAISSTGPVSFLAIFDETGTRIGQNHRRGAALQALSVYHPDVFEFIQSKLDGTLKSMNISIIVDASFMEKKDEDSVSLWYPEKTKENPEEYVTVQYISECYAYPKENFFYISHTGEMRKKKVWNKVMKKEIWNLLCECAWRTGDPGLLFWDRIKEDWYGEDDIHSTNPCQPKGSILLDKNGFKRIEDDGDNWTSWYTGVKEVFEVKTNIGAKFYTTKEHLCQLNNKTWSRAEDLVERKLRHPKEIAPDITIYPDRDQQVRGFLFGNGFLTGGRHGISVKLDVSKESEMANLLFKYGMHLQNDKKCFYCNRDKFPLKTEFLEQQVWERNLPEDILTGNFSSTLNFLTGLFEANGSAKKNGQIALKSTNGDMIYQVQMILLSIGIHCAVSEEPEKKIKLNNDEYLSKKSYNLQIPKSSAIKFKKYIGFISAKKMSKIDLSSKIDKTNIIVTSVRSVGEMEVWDYAMKDKPNYNICQGFILHNCGEEPLPAWSACNLGGLNLAAYEGEDFEKDVKAMIVFLNLILDLCIEKGLYPLEKQREAARKYRQVGLWLTGVADWFILNGIKYGDTEKFESIMEKKNLAERDAAEKVFEITGKRNSQLSTFAPTGSISQLLGCSSGIEPNFEFTYEKEMNGEFVKIESDIKNKAKTEDVLLTAHDISIEDRIRVQQIAQKYTDGSISSTLNLSSSAKIEDVKKVYDSAFKAGLKGVTIFRDGCKTGALRKPEKPIKREEEILEGKTIKVPVGDQSWYVTINFIDDHPSEVFINAGKSGSDDKAWTEALGRVMSLYLQTKESEGVKLIDALIDIKGSQTIFKSGWAIQSGPDAIAKALSHVLSHGGFAKCPKCGKGSFLFIEGCGICKSCGYEKCG